MSHVADPPDSSRIRVISAPLPGEPEPIWPDAPRYASGRELPAYRFVRGQNPHPTRDPEGHSFGLHEPAPGPLELNDWRESASYLYGIDLYHNGYLWEAHEAWEGLWRIAEEDSLEANFLQALILNSAAQLKAHEGNSAGVRTHSQAARWRLARVRSRGYDGPDVRFLGVDVADLVRQLKRHYRLAWESTGRDAVRLQGDAPRLVLER
jgi:hypothetical protein